MLDYFLPLYKQSITSHMLFSSFVSFEIQWETLRGAEKNKKIENLEANVVPNRMDNESHQLGSFSDLNLDEKQLI